MKRMLVVIAWWFLMWSGGGAEGGAYFATTVGPFDTQTRCEDARAAVDNNKGGHPLYSGEWKTFPCWRGTEDERKLL